MTYISQARLKKKALSYVCQRLTKSGKVNLRSTMKKRKLLTWISSVTCKNVKVKTAGEVVELKEDRLLLARLMMVCKSRPEIGIKEAVRVHAYLGKAVKGQVKY